ncbi:MAG: TIM barrel protein [Verrucomicrobia bacterium]|jgi:sugar phosphate isomerase/epimerase|nr:TIM barrel protein [Verrucomicrobiota bacterium]
MIPLIRLPMNPTTPNAMENAISFITANFVARELDYHMTGGWMEGDEATNAAFKPLETFAGKFGGILDEVKALGFDRIDIWTAHLNPAWAGEEHLAIARKLLEERGLKVMSLAGGFGDGLDGLAASCRTAKAVGAEMLAGGLPVYGEQPEEVLAVLRDHDITWAFENHPDEKSVADVHKVVGANPPANVGVACDTGWFGTNGVDAAAALRELAPICRQIHLKDVREAGRHRTCALGEGVVDIPACVEALRETGYTGPIAIEHEPESYNPVEEIRLSRQRLQEWMRS